jgi:hypothetical protein
MSTVLEDIKAWAESNKPKEKAKKGKVTSKQEPLLAFGEMKKGKPKTQIEKDIEAWAKGK